MISLAELEAEPPNLSVQSFLLSQILTERETKFITVWYSEMYIIFFSQHSTQFKNLLRILMWISLVSLET